MMGAEEISLVLGGFVAVLFASSYVFSPLFRRDFPQAELGMTHSGEIYAMKERCLKQLEELELDNRTRKVAPGDYAREKERLLQKIAACMSELDSMRAGSDEVSPQRF